MQFDISFDDADSRPKRKVPSRFAAKMRKPETEPSGNAEKNVGSSQPNDPPPADTTCAHAIFLNCSESRHIRKVADPLCTDSATVYTKENCVAAVGIYQAFNR